MGCYSGGSMCGSPFPYRMVGCRSESYSHSLLVYIPDYGCDDYGTLVYFGLFRPEFEKGWRKWSLREK